MGDWIVYNFISHAQVIKYSRPAVPARLLALLREISEDLSRYMWAHSGNVAKRTVRPAKIVNDKSIEWAESLTLPLLYNREFEFEIYDKHEFGYNPEEFQTMLVGTLSVVDLSQKHSTWEILTSGKEKIGFLSASIASRNNSFVGRKESLVRN